MTSHSCSATGEACNNMLYKGVLFRAIKRFLILSREDRRLHLSFDGGFIYQLRIDRIEHLVQAISLTASMEASAEVANLVDSGSSPLGLVEFLWL